MKGLGKSKIFHLGSDEDVLIEAFAPVEGEKDSYRKIAFKSSLIDYVFEIDEKMSGITLNSGVTIPVALSFADLKKQVYEPDLDTGNGIDLTLVTGQAASAAQALRLSKSFNPAAEAAKAESADKTLEIIMIVHGNYNDREFKRIRLREDQISYFEAHPYRKESEIFIQLKSGVFVDGLNKFYAAVPLDQFTYFLNQAKSGGDVVLDLGERTRPKSAKNLEMGS